MKVAHFGITEMVSIVTHAMKNYISITQPCYGVKIDFTVFLVLTDFGYAEVQHVKNLLTSSRNSNHTEDMMAPRPKCRNVTRAAINRRTSKLCPDVIQLFNILLEEGVGF